jgi:hypothetical protein
MKRWKDKIGRLSRRAAVAVLLVVLTRLVLWLTAVADRDLHQVELIGTSAREWLPYSYGWRKIEVSPQLEQFQLDLDL